MALYTTTAEGINTVFPVSAYDPTNPQSIGITANWGDGSEESVQVSRYNNKDREYYYEFNKTYEFPGTYTASISGFRYSSQLASTSKQLATYIVTVDTLSAQEPYPVLKIADLANFVDYKVFYFNVDDDGVNRGWVNRQISIPVSFGNTVLGYLSASYSTAVSGIIGISLSANQISNQNWPLRTRLPFEIQELDNNQMPPVFSSLLRGYVYVYEATTNSAVFL